MSLVAIDGDTVKCDGISMRLLGDGAPFVSGVDAPETSRARCNAERELGEQSRQRLSELLQNISAVEDSGVRDPFDRPLVRVRLADGRTAGAVLIAEGLATEWVPKYNATWCD